MGRCWNLPHLPAYLHVCIIDYVLSNHYRCGNDGEDPILGFRVQKWWCAYTSSIKLLLLNSSSTSRSYILHTSLLLLPVLLKVQGKQIRDLASWFLKCRKWDCWISLYKLLRRLKMMIIVMLIYVSSSLREHFIGKSSWAFISM